MRDSCFNRVELYAHPTREDTCKGKKQ